MHKKFNKNWQTHSQDILSLYNVIMACQQKVAHLNIQQTHWNISTQLDACVDNGNSGGHTCVYVFVPVKGIQTPLLRLFSHSSPWPALLDRKKYEPGLANTSLLPVSQNASQDAADHFNYTILLYCTSSAFHNFKAIVVMYSFIFKDMNQVLLTYLTITKNDSYSCRICIKPHNQPHTHTHTIDSVPHPISLSSSLTHFSLFSPMSHHAPLSVLLKVTSNTHTDTHMYVWSTHTHVHTHNVTLDKSLKTPHLSQHLTDVT